MSFTKEIGKYVLDNYYNYVNFDGDQYHTKDDIKIYGIGLPPNRVMGGTTIDDSRVLTNILMASRITVVAYNTEYIVKDMIELQEAMRDIEIVKLGIL